jgi:hypothetical protein
MQKYFLLFLGLFIFPLIAETQPLYPVIQDGKWGYMNRNGEIAITPAYSWAQWNFCGKVSLVRDSNFYFFITRGGVPVSTERYDRVSTGWKDYCIVGNKGKLGYVDTNGVLVIPLQFEEAGFLSGGIACVTKNGQQGIIDVKGTFAPHPEWDEITNINEGFVAFRIGKRWGIYNAIERRVVSKPKFSLVYYMENGQVIVSNGKKMGILAKSGKMVVPFIYDNISPSVQAPFAYLSGRKDSLYIIRRKGKEGVMDHAGKVILKPKYKTIFNYSEGFAVFIENGKKGIINKKGSVVVAPVYDMIYNFSEEVSVVNKNGKYGVIDPTGRILVECKYDWAGYCRDGLIPVIEGGNGDYTIHNKDSRFGYIDKTGRIIWPPSY